MGIRRLVQGSGDDTGFLLGQGKALVLLQKEDDCFECLYISHEDEVDFDKLLRFDSVKEAKFIGPREIYDRISDLKLDWPDFKVKKIITSPVKAIFYHASGKVRIQAEEVQAKKKVLVVDDSKTIQKLLKKIISSSDKLEVMGIADRPSAAREIIERETPDLITLDIHMPEMNGVEFLKSYLKQKRIPTIMISSVSMTEGPLVMEALSNGALTYIQKPSLEKMDKLLPQIVNEIEVVSQKSIPLSSLTSKGRTKTLNKFNHSTGLIAIGSSTGGTQALEDLFVCLPDTIPPIVVTQHIPAVFSKALADRLNQLCKFEVKEAEDEEFLQENTIYIAPGGKQFKLLQRGDKIKTVVNDDEPVNRFRPSVDYLFESVAKLRQENIIGVILTGMGKDGAQGLLTMKDAGAFTIAQDEASSVVFGMPKRAIELGAAMKVLDLNKIVDELVLQFNKYNLDKTA